MTASVRNREREGKRRAQSPPVWRAGGRRRTASEAEEAQGAVRPHRATHSSSPGSWVPEQTKAEK